MDIISYTISGMITSFTQLYINSRMLDKKLNNKIILSVIIFIIITVYMMTSYYLTTNFTRPVLSLIILIICMKALYSEPLIKTIISSFLTWILIFIIETLFTILILCLFKIPLDEFRNKFFANELGSLFIMSVGCLTVEITKCSKILNLILKKINNVKKEYIMIFLLMITISFSIIFYSSYFNLNYIYNFVFCMIITIIYTIIIFALFKEKSDASKLFIEKELLSNSLSDYEQLYERQRIDNHENRNQLLIIKSMVGVRNKKLHNYIDQITDIENLDNHNYIEQLRKLPSNGIRGLINFKIIEMKQKRIDVNLYISKKINFKKLNQINDVISLDICKLLGIYIDNAIQAVENLKNRNVDISIYDEDNILYIEITNNYDEKIEISKLNIKGYSTKGKAHGFGLTVAKKVLEKNKDIENETNISNNIFSQKIKIKM